MAPIGVIDVEYSPYHERLDQGSIIRFEYANQTPLSIEACNLLASDKSASVSEVFDNGFRIGDFINLSVMPSSQVQEQARDIAKTLSSRGSNHPANICSLLGQQANNIPSLSLQYCTLNSIVHHTKDPVGLEKTVKWMDDITKQKGQIPHEDYPTLFRFLREHNLIPRTDSVPHDIKFRPNKSLSTNNYAHDVANTFATSHTYQNSYIQSNNLIMYDSNNHCAPLPDVLFPVAGKIVNMTSNTIDVYCGISIDLAHDWFTHVELELRGRLLVTPSPTSDPPLTLKQLQKYTKNPINNTSKNKITDSSHPPQGHLNVFPPKYQRCVSPYPMTWYQSFSKKQQQKYRSVSNLDDSNKPTVYWRLDRGSNDLITLRQMKALKQIQSSHPDDLPESIQHVVFRPTHLNLLNPTGLALFCAKLLVFDGKDNLIPNSHQQLRQIAVDVSRDEMRSGKYSFHVETHIPNQLCKILLFIITNNVQDIDDLKLKHGKDQTVIRDFFEKIIPYTRNSTELQSLTISNWCWKAPTLAIALQQLFVRSYQLLYARYRSMGFSLQSYMISPRHVKDIPWMSNLYDRYLLLPRSEAKHQITLKVTPSNANKNVGNRDVENNVKNNGENLANIDISNLPIIPGLTDFYIPSENGLQSQLLQTSIAQREKQKEGGESDSQQWSQPRDLVLHPQALYDPFSKYEQDNTLKNIRNLGINLNSGQLQALQHVLDHSISLIQGPPGTGKTQCVAAMIASWVGFLGRNPVFSDLNNTVLNQLKNKSTRITREIMEKYDVGRGPVLASAFSNVGVDQILLRLISFPGFSLDCDPEFREYEKKTGQYIQGITRFKDYNGPYFPIIRIGMAEKMHPLTKLLTPESYAERKLFLKGSIMSDIPEQLEKLRNDLDAGIITSEKYALKFDNLRSKSIKQQGEMRISAQEILLQAPIVGASCIAAVGPKLRTLSFSMVVVDECTQATETALLCPITKLVPPTFAPKYKQPQPQPQPQLQPQPQQSMDIKKRKRKKSKKQTNVGEEDGIIEELEQKEQREQYEGDIEEKIKEEGGLKVRLHKSEYTDRERLEMPNNQFSRLVLVGDQCQLPPVMIHDISILSGTSTSIFQRLLDNILIPRTNLAEFFTKKQLDTPSIYPRSNVPSSSLHLQYRMHSMISFWSNSLFYNQFLKTGVPNSSRGILHGIQSKIITVEPTTTSTSTTTATSNSDQTSKAIKLNKTQKKLLAQQKSIEEEYHDIFDGFSCYDKHTSQILFYDVDGTESSPPNSQSKMNVAQAKVVISIVLRLLGPDYQKAAIPTHGHMNRNSRNRDVTSESLTYQPARLNPGDIEIDIRSTLENMRSYIDDTNIDTNTSTDTNINSTISENDTMSEVFDFSIANKRKSKTKEYLTQNQIGIVTPYVAQIFYIKTELRKLGLGNVEVKSIDGFQGREKEAIIFTTVRSNDIGSIGFLKSPQRVNVAITRAKQGLYIVGNQKTLKSCKLWNIFLYGLEKYSLVCKVNKSLEVF